MNGSCLNSQLHDVTLNRHSFHTVRGTYRFLMISRLILIVPSANDGTKTIVFLPIPGIEPGPSGWKPDILTTRQYGIWDTHSQCAVVQKKANKQPNFRIRFSNNSACTVFVEASWSPKRRIIPGKLKKPICKALCVKWFVLALIAFIELISWNWSGHQFSRLCACVGPQPCARRLAMQQACSRALRWLEV